MGFLGKDETLVLGMENFNFFIFRGKVVGELKIASWATFRTSTTRLKLLGTYSAVINSNHIFYRLNCYDYQISDFTVITYIKYIYIYTLTT